MSIKNTRNCYGALSKTLHWLLFILLCGMIAVGFYMGDMPKGPEKWELYNYHKVAGITILFIILFRLFWRVINVTPDYPNEMPLVEKIASHVMHWSLYLLMLAMPLSGWIMSTAANKLPHIGAWTIPKFPFIPESEAWGSVNHAIHVYGVWVLIGFATLHILAALKHHFIDRDNILRRMIPYGNALD